MKATVVKVAHQAAPCQLWVQVMNQRIVCFQLRSDGVRVRHLSSTLVSQQPSNLKLAPKCENDTSPLVVFGIDRDVPCVHVPPCLCGVTTYLKCSCNISCSSNLWFGQSLELKGGYWKLYVSFSETNLRKLYGLLYGSLRKLIFGNYAVFFGNYSSETLRFESTVRKLRRVEK